MQASDHFAVQAVETPPTMDIAFQLSKIAPVAGQVVVLTVPVGTPHDNAVNVARNVMSILPEGVSIAILDASINVIVANVPEFLAMLTKPEVTH